MCRRTYVLGAALSLVTATATAQQLFNFTEPEGPASVPSASADGVIGPIVGASRAIRIDLELLRSNPARLELPTPDGEVLEIERAFFEDRADGNALWTGKVSGSDFESVVLTIQDGQLVGSYGEIGQHGFTVGASAAGGSVRKASEEERPEGGMEWCSVRHEPPPTSSPPPEDFQLPPENRARRVDVLVLYTPSVRQEWEDYGSGTAAEIQAAIDYTNQVYRNSGVNARVSLVHSALALSFLDSSDDVLEDLRESQTVKNLRKAHRADIVMVFVNNTDAPAGEAWVYLNYDTVASMSAKAFGQTNLQGGGIAWNRATFAHEIGHIYGANHDPGNSSISPEDARRTYAYGYQDPVPDPPFYTLMAYSTGLSNDAVRVPYFSSAYRLHPASYRELGSYTRDNETAVRASIPDAVRFSDYVLALGAPTNLKATPTVDDGGTALVELSWTDTAADETGYRVQYRLAGGGVWADAATLAADSESTAISSLKLEAEYSFRVGASGGSRTTWSDPLSVTTPEMPDVEVAKPSGVVVVDEGMCTEEGLATEIAAACELGHPAGYAVVEWQWTPPPNFRAVAVEACFDFEELVSGARNGEQWQRWDALDRVCRPEPFEALRWAVPAYEWQEDRSIRSVLLTGTQDVAGQSERRKFKVGPLGHRPGKPTLTGHVIDEPEGPVVALSWHSEEPAKPYNRPTSYRAMAKRPGGDWEPVGEIVRQQPNEELGGQARLRGLDPGRWNLRVRAKNEYGKRFSNMIHLRVPQK